MDRNDEKLAGTCGICAEEARKIFAEAAEAHERIVEKIDAMYRRKERDCDDPGETQAEMIQRYARYDY